MLSNVGSYKVPILLKGYWRESDRQAPEFCGKECFRRAFGMSLRRLACKFGSSSTDLSLFRGKLTGSIGDLVLVWDCTCLESICC